MNNQFLTSLRERVVLIQSKVHAINAGTVTNYPNNRFSNQANPAYRGEPGQQVSAAAETPANYPNGEPMSLQAPLQGESANYPNGEQPNLVRAGYPGSEPTYAAPAWIGDVQDEVNKLLAFVDGEIRAPKTAAQYEAEGRNTAPRPGENPTQTVNRLAAERAANPLYPHQVPNVNPTMVHPIPAVR